MAEEQASRGLNKPCILIIVIGGMERFAFKGVASNMVTYLTDVMAMGNSSAAMFVNNWVGFTWMLPLAVAMLADAYWDRYTTILASSILYASGLLALTSRAVPSNKKGSISTLSWSLYMISLGQGGYKPSLQAFGAEQLENEDDEASRSRKSAFFHWWYFGVCCGSLLGFSVMPYIQDNLGWGLGFAIPTLSMMISILMFLCGNRFYVRKQSKGGEGKMFEDVLRAIKARVSKIINIGSCLPRHEYTAVELELQEKEALCNHDLEKELPKSDYAESNPDEPHHFLEAATIVLRLLPVWLMLLMFAVIFQQPATFFTKQGMTMKRNIGSTFKIPPAALQSAITVSIIILMPFYDTFFIRTVKILMRNEKGISVMQRMGIGMCVSVVAMIIAAVTERKRLKISASVAGSEDVPMSIFWLLPQYVLLGISDIFTVVGAQEFFYGEVPVRMRTMGIALDASVFGVGSYLSAFLISVIKEVTGNEGKGDNWFSDDMSKARLDKYYWFLALASGVSFLAFVIFSRFR